jgi:predicted dienelactone hydrolase
VLTSYSAADGGFGPAVTTRRTGDGKLGTGPDGGADTVAIFRPAAAKYGLGGVQHPIVVWGNGSTNTVDIWQNRLQRLATYGFVVVAPEQTQVTAVQMNAAIDYVIRLATDPTGSDCGRIDTSRIAAIGYSLGGMGALSVATDARIKASFIFASNNAQAVRNIKAPWAIMSGEMDETFAWSSVKSLVTGSPQPAFGAAVAGATHTTLLGANNTVWEAQTGFLRWRLLGEEAGKALFVGPSCTYCTNTTFFSEVVKTTTFDSL